MLRRSIFQFQQVRKVPSLIAMLSNRASSLNGKTRSSSSSTNNKIDYDNETRNKIGFQIALPSSIENKNNNNNQITVDHDQNKKPPTTHDTKSSKKKGNPALVFADLSRLKSRYSQSEIERRQNISDMKHALAEVEIQSAQLQHQVSGSAIVADDENYKNDEQRIQELKHA